MTTANDYQRFADECLAWAREAETDAKRKAFLDMAKAWTLAAAKVNGGIVRAASFRAKVAFLYDAFVRLSWPLNLIFEVAVPLGQLLCHLVCTARSITIEHGGLQRHRLTELEFVRALGAVHLVQLCRTGGGHPGIIAG
jgi:hypothetical protein